MLPQVEDGFVAYASGDVVVPPFGEMPFELRPPVLRAPLGRFCGKPLHSLRSVLNRMEEDR